MNSKLSNILKSGFAALVLLLSSSALKAQGTAYITNFTDCDMIAEITYVSNCVNCISETITVLANTTTPLEESTTCAGPVKVKVSPEDCPSSSAALVTTEKCQCSTGTITDYDCFTMTSDCCEEEGTIIMVGAQCDGSDMHVTITTVTSCP